MVPLGTPSLRRLASNPGLALGRSRLLATSLKSPTRVSRGRVNFNPPSFVGPMLHIKARSLDMNPEIILDDTIERSLKCKLNTDSEDDAPAPRGPLSIAFTDIKNSTLLWEASAEAMLKALDIHDNIMRQSMKSHSGYEVKVIGDAFMVAFPDAASALSWCLTVQHDLVTADWPREILENDCGREVLDSDGNVIFRGLSVRMGVHWGKPIDKMDLLTRRHDYIGPMVHRAARAIEVADGGQIVVTHELLEECRKAFTKVDGGDSEGVEVNGTEGKRSSGVYPDMTLWLMVPSVVS